MSRIEVKHITKPSSTREVTYGELWAILARKFPNDIFHLSDNKNYKLCNLKDINRFLEADKTDSIKYVEDRYDCDDYAFRLMGQFSVPDWSDLCIGLMWTDLHALLCLVDQNEDFWFLEPQNDNLLPDLEGWMGSSLRILMM